MRLLAAGLGDPLALALAGLATAAFLIIALSTTEMPDFFKYPMAIVAAGSFIIGIVQYYKEWKTNQLF
ncbi:MAG: hypothetical protein EOP48_31145 [Sphingobacteriales bacterium]|nr:MAG: hypothetical protein EOP48_31145 [Sphingobacteriales bacterium]